MSTKQKTAFADRKMLGRAIKDSFVKLSPKTQAKNPVMFLVFVAAILTSILWVVSLFGLKDAPSGCRRWAWHHLSQQDHAASQQGRFGKARPQSGLPHLPGQA